MDPSDFYDNFDLGDNEYLNSFEDSAADLKFRSIKVDSFVPQDYFPATHNYSAASTLPIPGQFGKFANVGPVKQNIEGGCPSVPPGVSINKFNINNQDYSTIVRSISEYVSNYNDQFDFSYFPQEHMWKGRYLCGSNSFDVDVNVYRGPASGYLVAVRKVKCDCGPNSTFSAFFSSMKSALCTDANCAPARKAFAIPCMANMLAPVTNDEFLEGIRPIFSMAKGIWESRMQSAKMLCDVSRKDAQYLELPQFRSECVRTLESFVTDECEDVRQLSIVAIAAFAELPSYQESFLRSRILSVLFNLVQNPADAQSAYETAQIRRSAATTLNLLSKSHAYAVRCGLQQQQCDVARWMKHVNDLADKRTREAAQELMVALEQVSTESLPITSSDDFGLINQGLSALAEEESSFAELIH